MEATFGEMLRRARSAANLSQSELAVRAGLTVNGISQLERGVRTRPYPHTFRVLADALGLDGESRARWLAAIPHANGTTVADPLPNAGPATEMIGRDSELATLVTALTSRRLVTLTGPGGVGKTTLAIAAARQVGKCFEGGTTLVALADVDEVGLALRTIGRELGLVDASGADVRDQLRAALQGAPRLMVLDNLEQLPGLASIIGDLVAELPALSVLTTSRAPLRLQMEHELPVRPLPLPEAGVDDVLASAAVRLLRARARPHLEAFEARDAAALATICHRLDGLPLAIELAAGWLSVLSPQELADRLDDALPLLVDGRGDLPARQRTMRDAIAWSDHLLGPDQQLALRRLAVLPAGWDLETAASVVDRPEADVLRSLRLLTERSLVQRAPADLDGHSRFGLLRTVRAYGREQLAAHDDADAARARLADTTLEFVRRASEELDGTDQARWLDRVEERLPNVRATLRWALDTGVPDLAARCYVGLMWSWYLRHATEGETWGREIVAALSNGGVLDSRTDEDPASHARAEATWALLSFTRGDPESAVARSCGALDRAETAGDAEGMLRALTVQANAAVATGDFDGARRAAERMREVEVPPEANSFAAVARAVVSVAEVRAALAEGDFDHADALLVIADRAVELTGAPWPRVLWLNVAVGADHLRGRCDRTLPMLQRSISLSQALGDAPAMLYALASLVVEMVLRTRHHEAARVLGAMDAHAQRTGQRITDPAVLHLLDRHRAHLNERIGDDLHELVEEGTALAPREALNQAVAGS